MTAKLAPRGLSPLCVHKALAAAAAEASRAPSWFSTSNPKRPSCFSSGRLPTTVGLRVGPVPLHGGLPPSQWVQPFQTDPFHPKAGLLPTGCEGCVCSSRGRCFFLGSTFSPGVCFYFQVPHSHFVFVCVSVSSSSHCVCCVVSVCLLGR